MSRLLPLLLLFAGVALGQELGQEPTPEKRSFWSMVLFWSGAVVVMALVGRVVFREQLNERRTIRALVDRIGPFFPEFDAGAITRWVHRCAPHVWAGWNTRDMSSIKDFATAEFMAESEAKFAAERDADRRHVARLEKVLKVHPIGLYMVGEGPPPADTELMLRLEFRAMDYVRDAAGQVVQGTDESTQVQYFWALRHDGHRWRLHHAEPALDDMTDLAERPPVPPIMQWRRPDETKEEG